jgi:Flp pilus assembly protein TadB
MTHLDLFTLIVDSIFYRCPNSIFVNIVFAFGLIWTTIRMRRDRREKVS